MVGFTALSHRDEGLALRLLDQQRSIIREHLARHQGREIKTMGDGFLVDFDASLQAVQCAMAVQAAMAQFNEPWRVDDAFFGDEK
jgi:class 3 adenylate cyclase